MKLNTAVIILAGIGAEAFTSPYGATSSREAFISSFNDNTFTGSCLYVFRKFGKLPSPATSQETSQPSPKSTTNKLEGRLDSLGGGNSGAMGSKKTSAAIGADPFIASDNFRDRSLRESIASSAITRSGGPGVNQNALSASERFRNRSLRDSVASSATTRSGGPGVASDINPFSASENFRDRSLRESIASSAALRNGGPGVVDNNALSASENFRDRPLRESIAGSAAVRIGGPNVVDTRALSASEQFRDRSLRESIAGSAAVRSGGPGFDQNALSTSERFRDRPLGKSVAKSAAVRNGEPGDVVDDSPFSATENFRNKQEWRSSYDKPLGQW